MSQIKITVTEVSYHRNGVGGEPFYAVLFQDEEQGNMVATVFPEPYHVAVLCVDKLNTVAFGHNSFRGDRYEPMLRQAIQDMQSNL